MLIKLDAEFQSLIPPLTNDEREQLEENILQEGIRDALVVWEGILIDGHNRYAIAQKHNLPYDTIEKHFDNREDVKRWIILNQFGRRNLSAYDRSILALKLKPIIAEKAKERQDLGLKSDEGSRTDVQLGKLAGVGKDTIRKVEKIEAKATPQVKADIQSGKISINQAYQTVRREEKKQEVKKRIDDYAKVQTGVIDIEKPKKKYNIIYADPPWQYWESGNKNQALHYTTMSVDDICKLPVKDIADNDCVLFLWVTYPILEEAFKVIRAWGFTYSTAAFVWIKKNKIADTPFIGCGAWTRANSELCLLATKGKIQRLDASISQIIESPIEEHSKKPDITRELIEKLVGKLPRVELFCRNAAEGWDVWGNEA